MSTVDVGRLRWIMTADSRQFDAAMRRTQRAFMGIGRAATAAIGVGGIGAAVGAAFRTADAIGKISRAAGLSVESLQELRFAFGEAGGEGRTFDRLILNFSRSLGDLQARGGGAMAEFLRRTDQGLLSTLFHAQDTEAALMALSDAVQGMDARRAGALLSAAFGRPNPAIVNLLRQRPEALAASRARTPDLLTAEQIQRAERLQDERQRLVEAALTQITQAVLNTAGLIESVVTDIREGFAELRDSFVGRTERWIRGLFD